MTSAAIILAAGQGVRMGRAMPKVMQMLGGRPLLMHVLDTVRGLEMDGIHVVSHPDHQAVQAMATEHGATVHLQEPPQGTADAVSCADAALNAEHVLILYGDVPLLCKETLQNLLSLLARADLALLTAVADNPYGYGRIVRDADGAMQKIIEQSDADESEQQITEVNTGIIAGKGSVLRRLIQQIKPDNAQNEYYLTDCIGLAVQAGLVVQTQTIADFSEAQGVNTPVDLERAERILQCRCAQQLMQSGCIVRDKSRLDIRGSVEVGQAVEIDVNVILEGKVVLGDGVRIGANCILKDVVVQAGTEIKPFSSIEASHIGKDCTIGPYARIRPEVKLDDGVKVGNFVEIKKSTLGKQSKINHLSYIGDSEVGCEVNVGAGTITCNYDGAHKHQTTIGDDVFIGSGTQLIAPVTIHAGATIGAGSTITHDAESGKLTVSRGKQQTIAHWKRPAKEPTGK